LGSRARSSRADSPALERVPQRAGQQVGAGLPLDEVVVRSCGNGLDTAVDAAVPGQHHERRRDRVALGGVPQPFDGVEPDGVREPQVDHQAVDPPDLQLCGGLGDRPRPAQLDLDLGVREELGDEHRVAVVVLDEQHAGRPVRISLPETVVAVVRPVHASDPMPRPGARHRPRPPARRRPAPDVVAPPAGRARSRNAHGVREGSHDVE
jgi:hypothetical protein